MKDRFWFIADSTLKSYAVIFFARQNWIGALLLAATLLNPPSGLTGLFAVSCANALAWFLGFDRGAIRKGYFGFNPLLVSLALAHFYAPSGNLLVLVFLSSLLTVFAAAALQSILWYYLRLPALSLPFVIVFSVSMAATVGFGKLELAPAGPAGPSLLPGLPAVELFLTSLGATLFQVNSLAGAVIFVAFLLHSRLALLLGAAGFAAGFVMHEMLGAFPQVLTEQYLGFNYILIALALGGIFVIPSGMSLVVAVTASAAAVLVMLGARVLLPPYLPLTAIPFNAVTLLVLYALKLRFQPSAAPVLSAHDVSSPEENLAAQRAQAKSQAASGVMLRLPFHGSWTVTQAFNGGSTHKDEWRFACDFMVAGADGEVFKAAGAVLEDYHCYDCPVFAPADGKVVSVKNDVPDNPVGRVNDRDNWGNAVIIEHGLSYYSCLAHLKESSVEVRPGESVRRGQAIARCGNSGHSPFPHLHMQMQALPQLGAPTLDFRFSNFLKTAGSQLTFVPRGILDDKDVVSNLPVPPDYLEFLPCPNTDYTYRIIRAGEREEHWSVETDAYGNLVIRSRPAETKVCLGADGGILSLTGLEGSRASGLYAVAQVPADLPLVPGQQLSWRSEEATDAPLPRYFVSFLDALSILGVGFLFELDNVLEGTNTSLKLTSTVRFKIRTPFGAFYSSGRARQLSRTFSKKLGLTHFQGQDIELQLVEARPRKMEDRHE